jgi:GTP cyclohydrolase II
MLWIDTTTQLYACHARGTKARFGHKQRRCVQEKGFDTVDANRQLGLPDDAREYTSVRNILENLQIQSIELIVRIAPFIVKVVRGIENICVTDAAAFCSCVAIV